MKKIKSLIIPFLCLLFFFSFQVIVSAQHELKPESLKSETQWEIRLFSNEFLGKAGYQTSTEQDIRLQIANIIRVILSFVGLLFLLLTFYGGYKWLTAAGNKEEIDKAKKTITQALIGFVVILLAYAIVSFISVYLLSVLQARPKEEIVPLQGGL